MQRRTLKAGFLALSTFACGGDAAGPEVQIPLPTAIAPAFGTVGTEVRIDGSAFAGRVEVRFDDLPAARVLLQDGAVFAVAPAGLVVGRTYRVRVLNEGTKADSAQLSFTAVPPDVDRVNGVTKPTGLRGMTLIVEGAAFGDSLALSQAHVYFSAAGGAKIEAPIADPPRDWADRFIVTTVPQEIGDVSWVWVETPTGASDSVEFRIIQSGLFSPSLINWTRTTSLPTPLQALGAVFVPIEDGPSPANYVFTAGGADSLGAPVAHVYRAVVQQSGALGGSWTSLTPLPQAVAYHALAAATPFTAAIDTATTAAFLYVLGGLGPDGQASPTVSFARITPDGALGAWQSTTQLPVALRAPSAVVFAGYVYVAGGANAQGMAQKSVYAARIRDDGTLEPWQPLTALPNAMSHGALVSFGPFLYAVGGETLATDPARATQTGSEAQHVQHARIDLRSRTIDAAGWGATSSMNKARSKHGAIFAGGAILVTSGVYAGQPGSSENSYASIRSDGTLQSWQGATGSETIDVELGISLYNQAVVTFIDDAGAGHVLVIGGADRDNAGKPSAGVVRY